MSMPSQLRTAGEALPGSVSILNRCVDDVDAAGAFLKPNTVHGTKPTGAAGVSHRAE